MQEIVYPLTSSLYLHTVHWPYIHVWYVQIMSYVDLTYKLNYGIYKETVTSKFILSLFKFFSFNEKVWQKLYLLDPLYFKILYCVSNFMQHFWIKIIYECIPLHGLMGRIRSSAIKISNINNYNFTFYGKFYKRR